MSKELNPWNNTYSPKGWTSEDWRKPKEKVEPPFKPNGIDAWSIGFDEMWQLLESLNRRSLYKGPSYPPYNILKSDDDHYTVEVAVAGFGKEHIKIVKEGNLLTVTGNKDSKTATYVHQGIAGRTFKQEFALADHIEVLYAELVDGILRINLERQLPEDKRPVIIELV